MEKKTSFMSLVYREYCITKKSAFASISCFVMGYGICIMYTLSAKFGNISRLDSGSGLASLALLMTPMVRMMGVLFAFMLFMNSIDGSTADLKNKTWALYRKSAPVSPFRLAMARLVYQLIAFLLSIGVSLLYLLVDCLISGKGIAGTDIGIIAVVSALIVLMSVSMTVCVEFARSTDKGMLLAMGAILVGLVPIFRLSKNRFDSGVATTDDLQAMLDLFAEKALLLFAVVMLLFVAEAVLLTLLYKRRDN